MHELSFEITRLPCKYKDEPRTEGVESGIWCAWVSSKPQNKTLLLNKDIPETERFLKCVAAVALFLGISAGDYGTHHVQR